MSQKEKLIQRLKSRSKDFIFDEMEKLLGYFEYKCLNKGRSSGSRVMFVHEKYPHILLHKPHPRKELLDYQMKQIIEVLEREGLL